MADSKGISDHIAHSTYNVDPVQTDVPSEKKQLEAPPYIKSLSPEERILAEKALVRKIDIRLIPTVIIIYIVSLCLTHSSNAYSKLICFR